MTMSIKKLGRNKYLIDLYDSRGKRIRKIYKLPKEDVEKIHIELKRRKYFDKDKVPYKTKMKVDEFFNRFIEYKRQTVSNSTYREYISRINFWREKHLEKSKFFFSLNRIEIEEIANKINLSPRTINYYINILKQIYNYALELNLIDSNPAKSIKALYQSPRKQPRFLSQEEAKLIIDNSSEFYKDLFKFLLYTGVRKDEARFLEWSDIDFKKNHVRIRIKATFTTKTRRGRNIPMNSAVNKVINKRYENKNSNYVFANQEGSNFSPTAWMKYLGNLIKKLEIKDIKIHTFRHTFASWLAMEGVDLATIAQLLGHSNIKTTMIYSHLAPDYVQKAVQRLPEI